MRSLTVAAACVVAIVVAPVPTVAKVLALVPFLVAAFMGALEAALITRAHLAAARYQEDRANALVVSWLGELRDEIERQEDEWREFGIDRSPLASVTPLPTRARVINLPSQRKPGSAS